MRRAVHTENEIRVTKKKLADVMIHDPAPITGLDMFKVLYGSGFKFDREAIAPELNAVADKIESEYADGKMIDKRPRVIITGCPIGGVTEKIIKAVEDNGAVVVGYENCVGAKQFDRLVDEDTDDIYKALSDRYLNIGCSVMTPNSNRYDLLGRMIDEYHADGVVEMTLSACHTYNVESKSIGRFVREEKGIPFISLETDYSTSDVAQLNTRVAAFIELLG